MSICVRVGGKLINIGSALSERRIPIQGVYSASKAAVMGFTDALQMELAQNNAPVSVSLIKPGAIDTPYKDRAANYMGVEGKNLPPVYAPETVATAILFSCEHHNRDTVVGAGGKAITILGNLIPGFSDKVMGKVMPKLQRTNKPIDGVRKGSLYEPGEDLEERGGYDMTRERSYYSTAVRHKYLTTCVVLGVAAAAYMASRARNHNGDRGFRGNRLH